MKKINNKFKKVFKKEKDIVIGAIHFPPLVGYPDFPGIKKALNNSIKDLKAFEEGGADAVIFENNYDVPHKTFVEPGTIAAMTYLGEKIKNNTKLPVGISVLWNDYKTALSIAKILDLQFIRIPVFVDDVKTSYDTIKADAKKIVDFRKEIGAEDVLVFADIHVKHAEIISKHSIEESTKLAIKNGADAVIVTGKWTGQSPDINELKRVRTAAQEFPIILGSGIDDKNIIELFKQSNGAIVSTSLKKGGNKKEVNVKSYEQRIDPKKVRTLVSKIK